MIKPRAKISNRRQITLPISLMRKLGLNPGDFIVFKENGDSFEIETTSNEKFSALDIIGKYPKLSKTKITDKTIKSARENMHHKDLTK